MQDKKAANIRYENAEIDRARMENIENKLEQIDNRLRFIVAANPASDAYVNRVFQDKPEAARLYLELKDNPKTQTQLQEALHISVGNVSQLCNYLLRLDFIKQLREGRVSSYTWSDQEQLLGVSEIAKQHNKK